MIVVRLARGGSKKRPFYHFHVADRREPRDGKYIERLGFFNPLARGGEEEMRLDTARLEYWLGQGAKMSDRVKSLAKRQKRKALDQEPKDGEAA